MQTELNVKHSSLPCDRTGNNIICSEICTYIMYNNIFVNQSIQFNIYTYICSNAGTRVVQGDYNCVTYTGHFNELQIVYSLLGYVSVNYVYSAGIYVLDIPRLCPPAQSLWSQLFITFQHPFYNLSSRCLSSTNHFVKLTQCHVKPNSDKQTNKYIIWHNYIDEPWLIYLPWYLYSSTVTCSVPFKVQRMK